MNQAQRKKALAEAQERLRLADGALKAAQDARTEAYLAMSGLERDIKRNEPLTEAQAEIVAYMHKLGLCLHHSKLLKVPFWVPGLAGLRSTTVRCSVFTGLRDRGILGEPIRVDTWQTKYPLSDWGKQVAEALAKAGEGKG